MRTYKSIKLTLLFLFCFFIIQISSAQSIYSETNFRSPLGIPLILSGNFAELRSNHFHTGIDVKTNGKSGYRIYAVDTGFVSRINISHWGYGKAIYVDHPNGYTSVYAHLSRFPKKIEEFLRAKQFEQKTETITLYLEKDDLRVSKGEIIAYSGNSGSSSGAHLHFEIRETESERPVNPLLFGFDVPDKISPNIYNIKIYTLENSIVNGKTEDLLVPVVGDKKNYHIDKTIVGLGEIGLGVHTIDKLDGASNVCGIYTIELYLDDQLIFKQKMEKLDFSTNRYINVHKDYDEFKKKRRSIHKSFLAKNNDLDIYSELINKGRILLTENRAYNFKYIVTDVSGNKSQLSFKIIGDTTIKLKSIDAKLSDNLDAVLKKDSVVMDDLSAFFPEKSMYESMTLNYKKEAYSNSLSGLHVLGKADVPLHKYFVLKLKMPLIENKYAEKALIVELSKDRKKITSKGGEYKDGWVLTEVRSFGNYALKLDTIAPKISPVNIYEGKNMKGNSKVQFKISDNLSGIQTYDVWVDDEWKLANYSPRAGTLTMYINDYNKINKGTHNCKVKVEDERGNFTIKTFNFNF